MTFEEQVFHTSQTNSTEWTILSGLMALNYLSQWSKVMYCWSQISLLALLPQESRSLQVPQGNETDNALSVSVCSQSWTSNSCKQMTAVNNEVYIYSPNYPQTSSWFICQKNNRATTSESALIILFWCTHFGAEVLVTLPNSGLEFVEVGAQAYEHQRKEP